jgi:hypothetical protein
MRGRVEGSNIEYVQKGGEGAVKVSEDKHDMSSNPSDQSKRSKIIQGRPWTLNQESGILQKYPSSPSENILSPDN